MLTRVDLRKIARARLCDADALLLARRYDGAAYLAGYAVELGLKVRICKVLKWTAYPSTNKEFQGLQSFKTHDLDRLLLLSGAEIKIKSRYMFDWSIAVGWNPETRYQPIGAVGQADAQQMIQSCRNLLGQL